MTRVRSALGLAGAAALLCGAAGNDPFVVLLLVGIWIAIFVALGLPAALLLHTLRPEWIAAEARAVHRRKTACVLVGSCLFVATVVIVGGLLNTQPALGVAASVPALAWFLVGFAGAARRQGERLTGTTDGARPLVLGWLARAGAFAVPVLWPIVGTYLVVVAFGAPLVAWGDRRSPAPAT